MGSMRDSCTVLLTFDFDAEALWEGSYGVTTPSTLSRGAYGANLGMPRILALLDRSDIKATFFVPGITAERYPDLVRRAHAAGHEVAHHGYLHVSPAKQTEEEERAALEKGLEILATLTGERPVGYRSPSWDLSARSLALLAEHDFLYDSSLMAWDAPYLVPVDDGPRRLVEIPVSWELDDAPYFLFASRPAYRVGLADPDRVFEIWRVEFEAAYAEGGTVCYTMHPQIIGRQHRLRMLERLIEHIRRYPGARFARAVDVARAVREGRTRA
ncbi:MAG: polysaccharide deacetylase [Candidatus Rokubacteria bacterium]|nr:polysaccharide deacetylase [Candidatus Rokubacteria bacterium]MBI2543898.1 polysaccharide deacetylase [Candidatus Rokubacteria bacterium]MBI2554242.1 polysaccharide deacetylase [Candidatus Rokubacteria bacterium]